MSSSINDEARTDVTAILPVLIAISVIVQRIIVVILGFPPFLEPIVDFILVILLVTLLFLFVFFFIILLLLLLLLFLSPAFYGPCLD